MYNGFYIHTIEPTLRTSKWSYNQHLTAKLHNVRINLVLLWQTFCEWYLSSSVETHIFPNETQIVKTLGSMLIRYRSDAKVSDQYLIDVALRVFAIWVSFGKICVSTEDDRYHSQKVCQSSARFMRTLWSIFSNWLSRSESSGLCRAWAHESWI